MKITPTHYAKAYLAAVKDLPARRTEIAKNLWQSVWHRGHFKWAKLIVTQVEQAIRLDEGKVLVEVATPQPLTEAAKKKLIQTYTQSLGQPVDLLCLIKPHLLAGAVITVNDRRYDASLKGRLDALYRTLAGEQTNN